MVHLEYLAGELVEPQIQTIVGHVGVNSFIRASRDLPVLLRSITRHCNFTSLACIGDHELGQVFQDKTSSQSMEGRNLVGVSSSEPGVLRLEKRFSGVNHAAAHGDASG